MQLNVTNYHMRFSNMITPGINLKLVTCKRYIGLRTCTDEDGVNCHVEHTHESRRYEIRQRYQNLLWQQNTLFIADHSMCTIGVHNA